MTQACHLRQSKVQQLPAPANPPPHPGARTDMPHSCCRAMHAEWRQADPPPQPNTQQCGACRTCARAQPASHCGVATALGSGKGWPFHMPEPSPYAPSYSSRMSCTPADERERGMRGASEGEPAWGLHGACMDQLRWGAWRIRGRACMEPELHACG